MILSQKVSKGKNKTKNETEQNLFSEVKAIAIVVLSFMFQLNDIYQN